MTLNLLIFATAHFHCIMSHPSGLGIGSQILKVLSEVWYIFIYIYIYFIFSVKFQLRLNSNLDQSMCLIFLVINFIHLLADCCEDPLWWNAFYSCRKQHQVHRVLQA